MNLEDKHKEFAVVCFARFMNIAATVDAFREEFQNDIPKPAPLQQNQDIEQYHLQVEQHKRSTREKIYQQLRRYNVTHPQFPQKYRELFHQARKEYFTCYLLEELQNDNTINKELETIYGFIKTRLFQNINSEQTISNAKLAHSLLKTIASYKISK